MKKPVVIVLRDEGEQHADGLINNLADIYTFTEAGTGHSALGKIVKSNPEIILHCTKKYTQQSLPIYTKIKEDARTKHLPVLVIGQPITDEEYINCLGAGITDYIPGPLNYVLVRHRIKNIIAQHTSLKNSLHKQVTIVPRELEIETNDEKFLKKALSIIETNLADPDFSVQQLSLQLYVSRVALYKKLLMLTGKAPIDFIRNVKMQRAIQLLKKSDLTIAEVAYEVGFNDPKYFSRFFKKEFDVLPSEVARNKEKYHHALINDVAWSGAVNYAE